MLAPLVSGVDVKNNTKNATTCIVVKGSMPKVSAEDMSSTYFIIFLNCFVTIMNIL